MKKFNAVGANIFAGGFTLGVSEHFNVLAHLEHDDYGVEVTKANFAKLPVFIGTETWPEKANRPIHFLYSNPPCAIWSLAGNMVGKDWRKDPRLQRVRDIFALVERYRPQVWCWESVCQAFEKGRPFVEELAATAARLGYSASYVLVDAQYLKAPQTRKRFFLVLHRVAIDWAQATPDFTSTVTVGQALRGIKPNAAWLPHQKKESYIEAPLFKHVGPGERFTQAFNKLNKKQLLNSKGKVIGRPGWLKVRLHPDKITGVVFGDSTFHWKEDRLLAMNELGALHGFPPTWDWVGNHHRLAVARGVLPPVGAWLAKAVAAAIRANKVLRKPEQTLVDFRTPPGAIQGVLALPGGVDLDWRPDRPAKPAAGRHRSAKAGVSPQATPWNPARKDPNRIRDLARAPRRPGKTTIRIKDLGDVRGSSRALLAGLARGTRPGTSGELIRARILEGKLSDEAIAAEVRARWEGRKTTIADVAWNRSQLRKGGAL